MVLSILPSRVNNVQPQTIITASVYSSSLQSDVMKIRRRGVFFCNYGRADAIGRSFLEFEDVIYYYY